RVVVFREQLVLQQSAGLVRVGEFGDEGDVRGRVEYRPAVFDQRQSFLEEQSGDLAQRWRETILPGARLDLPGDGELLVTRRGDVCNARLPEQRLVVCHHVDAVVVGKAVDLAVERQIRDRT